MLDFLNQVLKKEDINLIQENIYASDVFNLNCNQDECLKIIKYLKDLGINDIETLIINRLYIFLDKIENIQKIIPSNINKEIIKEINDNYTNIDLIYN